MNRRFTSIPQNKPEQTNKSEQKKTETSEANVRYVPPHLKKQQGSSTTNSYDILKLVNSKGNLKDNSMLSNKKDFPSLTKKCNNKEQNEECKEKQKAKIQGAWAKQCDTIYQPPLPTPKYVAPVDVEEVKPEKPVDTFTYIPIVPFHKTKYDKDFADQDEYNSDNKEDFFINNNDDDDVYTDEDF